MITIALNLWSKVRGPTGPATGTGQMRFNLNPGNDTGLLALLEDI